MKYVNQLSKEGKLTTRPNEDRGKGERQILKDTSLYQAAVCLQCEKKKCIGTDRCFGREAANVIDENDYSHKIIKGTSLAWTEEEIVQHYREAKDQRAMIGILADLNNVSCDKIRKVLKKHGIKTGADVKPKKKRKAAPPAEPIKERKTACQKVYIKLVSGGVSYSVDQIQRRIGRSATYIKARIKGNDRVVLGGVEYQIMRYERWSKHGCSGKIETRAEKT